MRATSSSWSFFAWRSASSRASRSVDVVAVVAGVVGDRAQAEVGDPRDDRVEEEPVVRDEDDRVRVLGQVAFEPVARVEIEVVGRLVEQQQAGLLQQQLRQRDAHLPAAGERLGRPLRVRLREAEAAQHRRDLQVDGVAVAVPELVAAARRSARASPRARPRAPTRRQAVSRARASRLRTSSRRWNAVATSSYTVRPLCASPSCGR